MEPLLGPVDVPLTGINWVIVGGESGPGARHMDPDWARSIRDQCKAAGVPFFFKQMARREPIPDDLLIREFPR
jgi:protein gp37